MNDESLPENYRDMLAQAAAPYCHSRLTSTPTAKAPYEMSDLEIEETIARQQAFERGEHTGQIVRLRGRR